MNLFFQICGNAVNPGTFFVEKICDSLLFCNFRKVCNKITIFKIRASYKVRSLVNKLISSKSLPANSPF